MGIAWVQDLAQGAALRPKPAAGLPSLPKLPPLPQLPQLPQLRPPTPLQAPPALPQFDITKPFVSLFRIGESVVNAIFHPGQQQQQQQRKTVSSKSSKRASSPSPAPVRVQVPPPVQQQQQQQPVMSTASTKVDLDVVEAFAMDAGDSGGARRLTTTPHHQRSLQEIIGTDDRQICPQRSFPWSAIGQIQVTDQSGLFICTGTLIRPDKVLTAAHCVWNTARNAFYQNLNFAPGRYNANGKVVNPWGVVPWKSVTILDSFKRNPSTWDVAVVTLQRPLGSTAGFMGMAAGCSSNTVLTVAGYPQDRSSGTCMSSTCRKATIACDAPTNSHTCDTVSGMSGSPMWDSRNRIRMIHVAGVEGQAENRATTLTQFLVNAIAGW
jgi:V8-like Glu-specific endopeptidase